MPDPAAPYPSDTRAKGWRFELDHERIRQSDTWALAAPEIRPWLLMLWMTAWEQVPCGSLPDDDELIAVRIGMPLDMFLASKDRLMRGWWRADDGRLYHRVLTERVLDMLRTKDKERKRKSDYRARMSGSRPKASHGSPELSHGTEQGQAPDSHGNDPGRDDTGTGTGINSVPTGVGTGTDVPPAGPDPDDDPPPPPPGLEPQEAIFQVAVPWFVARGVPDRSARSLLGGAVKQLGAEEAWKLASECIRVGALEPAAWLSKALNERIAARAGPGGGRRKGSRADDRAAWNAELSEVLAEGGQRAEKDMGVIDVSGR